MTTLLENPLPIYALGAILLTIAGLAVAARRTLSAAIAFVAVLCVTLALLLAEHFVVTDREKVEEALGGIIAAIQQNDAGGVVAWIDPQSPEIVDDARTLMGLVQVKQAGYSALKVDVEGDAATARFRGMLSATTRKGGAPVGFYDEVEVTWIRRDEAWKLNGYTAFHEGNPINAVNSARSRRPVGGGE